MKTDKQIYTLLSADLETLGEALLDFADAADLTAWPPAHRPWPPRSPILNTGRRNKECNRSTIPRYNKP